MRGDDRGPETMFSYIRPEQQVPADHPLRPIRTMVDTALRELSGEFARLYPKTGRPSIPSEKLLRALLVRMRYSVRSERQLDVARREVPRHGLPHVAEADESDAGHAVLLRSLEPGDRGLESASPRAGGTDTGPGREPAGKRGDQRPRTVSPRESAAVA
jgi:hypothetical protein